MTRKPKQKRAQETVDAIVEAGFICVARVGMSGATTRKIADAAGVGVASLYDYFENKEAVFDAMRRKFADDAVRMIRDMIPEVVELEVRDATTMIFHRLGELLTRDERRYLKTVRDMLDSDMDGMRAPIATALNELFVQYLIRNPRFTQIPNLQSMVYIFVNGGILLAVHHLSSDSPMISAEEFIKGYADLVSGYVEHKIGCDGTDGAV